MSQKVTQKHGLLGGTIKVIMVVIFALIGAAILAVGIVGLVKKYDPQWVSICNTVFGACLLTSPFFLSHKRGGLNKVIKILMVIVFVIIGILFIVAGTLGWINNWYPDAKWYPIVNIVFGCLLFTSPFFLKKSI